MAAAIGLVATSGFALAAKVSIEGRKRTGFEVTGRVPGPLKRPFGAEISAPNIFDAKTVLTSNSLP
jgi:hypothetical protein